MNLNTNPQKLFYKIGEVAKEFNVNVSLIRFWEKEFDILKERIQKQFQLSCFRILSSIFPLVIFYILQI